MLLKDISHTYITYVTVMLVICVTVLSQGMFWRVVQSDLSLMLLTLHYYSLIKSQSQHYCFVPLSWSPTVYVRNQVEFKMSQILYKVRWVILSMQWISKVMISVMLCPQHYTHCFVNCSFDMYQIFFSFAIVLIASFLSYSCPRISTIRL